MSDKTFADYGIEIAADVASGQTRQTCPQCSPLRQKKHIRCLSIDLDEGRWYCHHCTWSGGLGTGTTERARDPNTGRPIYRQPKTVQNRKAPSEAADWLRSRGISRETANALGIGWAQTYMPQREDWVEAFHYPYWAQRPVDGETQWVLVNRKWRDLDKNFRMERGCERVLYNLPALDEVCTVITEGEQDVAAFHEAGIPNAVSVPDGAPNPEAKDYAAKFDFLEADWGAISKVRQWALCLDNDAPGRALEAELIRRLGAEKCIRMHLPEDCKDANEALLRHGPDALVDALAGAQAVPVPGLVDVGASPESLVDRYHNGVARWHETGWMELDRWYRVRPGDLCVVTGIPHSGKSHFVDNLMLNLVRRNGWRFAVCSPESNPVDEYRAALAEKWVGRPFSRSWNDRMSEDELRLALERLSGHIWIFNSDSSEVEEAGSMSVAWIIEKATRLVRQRGIHGLIIDPWNQLEHQRPQAKTETEHIGECLTELSRFARRNQVAVWIVAHPTKLLRRQDGTYPVPTPYDINGGANWFNRADVCLCVWRDMTEEENPPRSTIFVQKVRRKEVGSAGPDSLVSLAFQPSTGVFRSWSPTAADE